MDDDILRQLTVVRHVRRGRSCGPVKVTKIDQREARVIKTFGGMRPEVGSFPNGKRHSWTSVAVFPGPRLWFANDYERCDRREKVKSDPAFETIVRNVIATIKARGGEPDEERVRRACERKFKRP